MKKAFVFTGEENNFAAYLHYNLLESILNFSLNETKFLLAIISLIDKKEDTFDTYQTYTGSIARLINMNVKEAYYGIKKAVSFFTDKVISIKDPKKNIPKDYQLFSKIKYDNGLLTFKFNNTVKPFLLNLQDNFIGVKPKEIPHLNSKYSIRIYLLIRKYQFMRKKYLEINIDELKALFGLEEKLSGFSSFKKHVLEPARLELENTLNAFEYEAVRIYGLKYEMIGFTLKHRYKTIKKSLEVPKPLYDSTYQ